MTHEEIREFVQYNRYLKLYNDEIQEIIINDIELLVLTAQRETIKEISNTL